VFLTYFSSYFLKLDAIILGIIQGLTEFLPVSSSGHLELGKQLLGLDLKEESLLFTIVVHFATALSTIVIYRNDIGKMTLDVMTMRWNDSTNFFMFILVSMVPAGFLGFYFGDNIDHFFATADRRVVIVIVGAMLSVTGALLFATEKFKAKKGILNYKKSFFIGISQAIAILPGISRSGATISTALLLGVNRKVAARFSFLMVLPVIIGAMLKKTMDIKEQGLPEDLNLIPIVTGFIAAFITGLFACKWMILLVRKSKLSYFAYYCLIVGIISIIASFSL